MSAGAEGQSLQARRGVCSSIPKTYAVALLQIEAKATLNGEKVEHQRTTFVKQLKLGKVGLPVHVIRYACGEGRGGAPPAPETA